MKKILFLSALIFLSAVPSFCEEVIEIGAPIYDTKNKPAIPVTPDLPVNSQENGVFDSTYQETAVPVNGQYFDDDDEIYVPKNPKGQKKWGIFKKKEVDPNKQEKFNTLTNKTEEIPRGYWGKLPNVKEAFSYKTKSLDMPSTSDIDAIIPESDLSSEVLQKAPYDDPLFLDKIIKQEETSQYLNDIQKTKFALIKLQKCIEENGDIQHYNAIVNVIDLYVKNLKNKYSTKAEAQKNSYNQILALNYEAKVLGNLIYDANFYARYTPTDEGQYSKYNINIQKQKLLANVIETLESIKEET